MASISARPITEDERSRLRDALSHLRPASRGLFGALLGGGKVAARHAAEAREVTVVTVQVTGERGLIKANTVPGDRGATLLELGDDGLLVVASSAFFGVLDPTTRTRAPHAQMTWTLGPEGVLLDYAGEGPSLKVGRPAQVTDAANAVLQRSWERIDGHVFPGKLSTCAADLERYVAHLPDQPVTIPVPGEGCGLLERALHERDAGYQPGRGR